MEQNNTDINGDKVVTEFPNSRIRTPLTQTKNKWMLLLFIMLGILVTGSLILFGYKQYEHSKLSKTIPISIRQNVDFPIFVPVSSNTKVDNQTFDYSNGILQFTVQNSDEQLRFSQQKKTPEFDISKFAGGIQITGVKQLALANGQLVIGSIQGRTIAIMDTGKTIITLTGTQSSSSAELVMRSLQKL